MRQALLIVDVQPSFSPPDWLVAAIQVLARAMPSVATVERHAEAQVPFERQLGWKPALDEDSLIEADRVYVKYGYLPPRDAIEHLASLAPERVLVCGIQADACVLAAGFALFDAGLTPTLIGDLVVGSSLDRSAQLGRQLWRHHFGAVIDDHRSLFAVGTQRPVLPA